MKLEKFNELARKLASARTLQIALARRLREIEALLEDTMKQEEQNDG